MHVPRTLTAYPRESFGVFVLGLATVFAVLGLAIAPSPPLSGPARASVPGLNGDSAGLGRPPAPEPLLLKNVAPDDARTINAVVPFSALPNPAARAFAPKFVDVRNEARALDCLTAAVYYEAAIEGADGQRAVAQVVLNRLRHPAYPATVCGVVFQGSERSTGCQFTFTCDGALARRPIPALWEKARAVAWGALTGQVHKPVGWSTHYHTDWVVPYWASSLAKASKVGTHIFYRWTGGWGLPAAFRGRYKGAEPSLTRMAGLSGAHADAVEVAVAADAALDSMAAGDGTVDATLLEGGTVGLDKVAAADLVALAEAREALAAKIGAPVVKSDAKIPWELRWALKGSAADAPQAPLGTAAPKAAEASKACEKEPLVFDPVGGPDRTFKVRERCGA